MQFSLWHEESENCYFHGEIVAFKSNVQVFKRWGPSGSLSHVEAVIYSDDHSINKTSVCHFHTIIILVFWLLVMPHRVPLGDLPAPPASWSISLNKKPNTSSQLFGLTVLICFARLEKHLYILWEACLLGLLLFHKLRLARKGRGGSTTCTLVVQMTRASPYKGHQLHLTPALKNTPTACSDTRLPPS